MADERLGASFSIDTTNLKAGLSQANRLIRESQSEFKAAAAGMDDWTKSEEGLNARIKSLNDITGIQKKKVSTLKSEYQNLIRSGLNPASKEAVDLRTKINNEEAALRSNEQEIKRQKKALENLSNAAEETEKSYSKLGDIAKTVGKVAAAAIAAAAAGVVAITKQSIESYAEYEQLVGGVDTLFGESSKKVQQYAANAYKTAGMSANEYMETITSFSASLLQSLGGDTDKAASVADMAISDMSDNANKMGTSIESIQSAYQGFAKQNYTMLDNLKLGYGGTKEEMQRLLRDATKLTGKKYNLNNLNDVYEAIHAVQDELGITGTTAKEASTTIQGSIASMKSAWSNLLTGMADENADFDGLITNLIDSVSTVASNLIPRIKVVLTGVVKLVAGLLPQISPMLNDMLPELITAAMSLIDGIIAQAPMIIQAVVGIIPKIATGLLEMLPALETALFTIVQETILSLSQMLPEIVSAIVSIIPQLIDVLIAQAPMIIQSLVVFLNESIPKLLVAAVKFFMAILDALPKLIAALLDKDNLPMIIDTIISTLLNNLPLIIDAAIQLFFGILDAIPKIQAELLRNLPSIISTIVVGLLKSIPELIKAGAQLLDGLFKGFLDPKRIAESVKSLFDGIVGGIKKLFGIQSPSKVMANLIGKNLALGIGVGFKDNIKDVNEMIGNSIDFPNPTSPNGRPTARGGVVVYQTNNYSQAHSRYELYKSKQQMVSAVRLAIAGV